MQMTLQYIGGAINFLCPTKLKTVLCFGFYNAEKELVQSGKAQ